MAASNTQNLLDEIFGSSSATETSTTQTPAPATPASPPPKPRNAIDDILGLFPNSNQTPSPNPINTMAPGLGALGNGLTSPVYGGGSTMPTSVPQSVFSSPQTQSPPQQPLQQQRLTTYTAYEKNELKVTLTPQTNPNRPGIVNVLARFQAMGQNAISGLSFQVAVPKVRYPFFWIFFFCRQKAGINVFLVLQNQQLQMMAMSNPNVNPGSVETQQMQIKAPVGVRSFSPLLTTLPLTHLMIILTAFPVLPQSQVRLRLRLSFLISGQPIQEQVDFSGFPPNLMTGGQ